MAWGAWLCAGDLHSPLPVSSALRSRGPVWPATDQFPVTHNQDDIAQQQRLTASEPSSATPLRFSPTTFSPSGYENQFRAPIYQSVLTQEL